MDDGYLFRTQRNHPTRKMKCVSIAFLALVVDNTDAFLSQHQRALVRSPWAGTKSSSLAAYPPRKNKRGPDNNNYEEGDDFDPVLDEPQGRRGDGRNWIEKSSPMGIGKLVEGVTDQTTGATEKETDGNYDLGVNGISFETGPLSERMYGALMGVAMKRFPAGATMPSELEDVYKRYAMDITAKEAVNAAFDQNGLQLALLDSGDGQNDDEGLWGDIDSVQLIDPATGEVEANGEVYDSLDSAVEEGDWEPGQAFNFIARNVPAKLKEMDVSDFLSKLDPDGALRSEAKDKGITLPDEDVASLKDLGLECDRRTKVAPFEAEDDETVYKGDGSKGYRVINRSDLLAESGNVDGTENDGTLMHVMDSLVSHSCLIIDLTDGGATFKDAIKLSKMWGTASNFFDVVKNDDEFMKSLPGMKMAVGAGSPHAVTGFSSYNEGSMQFLETRIVRDSEDRNIVPEEGVKVIGEEGVTSLVDAFDVMCDAGKDLVRVAVAAANMEYGGFIEESSAEEESSDLPFISGLTFEDAEVSGVGMNDKGDIVASARMCSEAAALMVDELIDDGKLYADNAEQGSINMSPHRLCRYEGKAKSDDEKSDSNSKETFGAHTDTTFLTMVPVAEVSGLEVFDEDANKWFRPELLARQVWENERKRQGLDPSAQTDTVTIFDGDEEKEVELPWYCRYVVAMPGELLQIATRNEVAAGVHRVVSVTDGDARISAPVLIRARSGMRMNLSKYFGRSETVGSLLKECDGMKMDEIHNALQPSNYRD